MRWVRFALCLSATAASAEGIEPTPLHTALFEAEHMLERTEQEGIGATPTGWTYSAQDLVDLISPVAPDACVETQGWVVCTASVEIMFTAMAGPVLSVKYEGFAYAPDGARCRYSGIVHPDPQMLLHMGTNSVTYFDSYESWLHNPKKVRLYRALRQVAEELSEPDVLVEVCLDVAETGF